MNHISVQEPKNYVDMIVSKFLMITHLNFLVLLLILSQQTLRSLVYVLVSLKCISFSTLNDPSESSGLQFTS